MWDDHQNDPLREGGLRYNDKGEYVGYSVPGMNGDLFHYNADGSFAGSSFPGAAGERYDYDAGGNYTGFSSPVYGGAADNFDRDGSHVGFTVPAVPDPDPFPGFDVSPDPFGMPDDG